MKGHSGHLLQFLDHAILFSVFGLLLILPLLYLPGKGLVIFSLQCTINASWRSSLICPTGHGGIPP